MIEKSIPGSPISLPVVVVLLIAVSSASFFLFSCDDRSCWKETIIDGSTYFRGIDGFSSKRVYARCSQSGLYQYNGMTWNLMKDSPGGSSILAFSENNIFAGGYHFDGTSWTHVLQGPFYIEDFWAAAEDDIFAVGFERKSPPDYAKSRIFHYDGVEWTEMENNFKTLLHGVWGSSSSDVFAVGPEKYDDSSDDGTIYHYDGESWSVMLDGAPSGLYGVWGSSANDVFVGGGRLILHYDGIEWSEMENPGGSYLDIWGVSPTEVYAAGYATGGWHFRYYDGNEWICMGKNLEGSYDAIWGSSVTDVFAVGVVLRDFNPVGIIAEYVCDEPGLSKRP